MINEELNYFKQQIVDSLTLFNQRIYPFNFENINCQFQPIKKSIFLEQLNYLDYSEDKYEHNCVPCNLDEGANIISQFLEYNMNCESIRYFVTIYSLLLYLQAERFGVIYQELGYKDGKGEFDWDSFPKLQLIKRWANFFKHPKSSMFIHHPTFHIKSFSRNPNFMFDGVIDSEFVNKYYSGPKKNGELFGVLKNNNFKIFFPDLVEFTALICDESDNLITAITSKKENIEKLKQFRNEIF